MNIFVNSWVTGGSWKFNVRIIHMSCTHRGKGPFRHTATTSETNYFIWLLLVCDGSSLGSMMLCKLQLCVVTVRQARRAKWRKNTFYASDFHKLYNTVGLVKSCFKPSMHIRCVLPGSNLVLLMFPLFPEYFLRCAIRQQQVQLKQCCVWKGLNIYRIQDILSWNSILHH